METLDILYHRFFKSDEMHLALFLQNFNDKFKLAAIKEVGKSVYIQFFTDFATEHCLDTREQMTLTFQNKQPSLKQQYVGECIVK